MKYQIDKTKLNEGLEEYMKSEVNAFEAFSYEITSTAKMNIARFNYTKEEKAKYLEQRKKNIKNYLQVRINLHAQTVPPIIPEEIFNKYLPEFQELAKKGEKTLDNLL